MSQTLFIYFYLYFSILSQILLCSKRTKRKKPNPPSPNLIPPKREERWLFYNPFGKKRKKKTNIYIIYLFILLVAENKNKNKKTKTKRKTNVCMPSRVITRKKKSAIEIRICFQKFLSTRADVEKCSNTPRTEFAKHAPYGLHCRNFGRHAFQ